MSKHVLSIRRYAASLLFASSIVHGQTQRPVNLHNASALTKDMSLDQVMMMVNMDRAHLLDTQVRAKAADIKKKNDELVRLNKEYAALTQKNRDLHNSTDPGAKQQIEDNQKKLTKMKQDIDNLTSTSQLEMTQLQSLMTKYNQTTEGLSNWLSKGSGSKATITGNLR